MEKYNNDFTKEKKEIKNSIDKRKVYARATPSKTNDEKLIGNYLRANKENEPLDRLLLEEQIKNLEHSNHIKGIAQILNVSDFIASKITIEELDHLENVEHYKHLLRLIDIRFTVNVKTRNIEISIKTLNDVGLEVPYELSILNQLYNNYAKNQRSKALTEVLTQCFPKMKKSNITAILKTL